MSLRLTRKDFLLITNYITEANLLITPITSASANVEEIGLMHLSSVVK